MPDGPPVVRSCGRDGHDFCPRDGASCRTGNAHGSALDRREPAHRSCGAFSGHRVAPTAAGRLEDSGGARVLAIALVLPLRSLLRLPGPAMEEGFMLAFPDRILQGDVPHRTFLHLYGPGSLWVLAGVYEVFGVRIVVERLVGLAQLAGVAFGVYALVRWWGRGVALTCGLLTVLFVLPALQLTAIPWVGGVALGLAALVDGAAGSPCVRRGRRRDAGRWAVAGGLLAGFALLYRIDLGLALGLAGGAAVWGLPRPLLRRSLVGLVIGASPYLVHLVLAGPGNVVRGMILDPMLHPGAGRHLPVPPDPDRLVGIATVIRYVDRSWPLPGLAPSWQLFVWFVALLVATVLLVVVAIWAVRRRPRAFTPRVLLTAALFGAGMLPQAIQRADSAHFAWVSAVTIAILPAAVAEVVRLRRPGTLGAREGAIAGVALLARVLTPVPHLHGTPVRGVRGGLGPGTSHSFAVSNGHRTFYVGDNAAFARSLDDLRLRWNRVGRPGDRLIVGTEGISGARRTPNFLDYLLPKYKPGHVFIEMEPGITNHSGTRLATDELRRADLVIQSSRWEPWEEPNDSMKPGTLDRTRSCGLSSVRWATTGALGL